MEIAHGTMPVSVCDLRTGRKLAAFRDVDLLDSQLLQTDLGLKARLGSASLWQNCRLPPRTARRGYTVPLTSSSTLAWKNAPDGLRYSVSIGIRVQSNLKKVTSFFSIRKRLICLRAHSCPPSRRQPRCFRNVPCHPSSTS